jgi:hypothetical protein
MTAEQREQLIADREQLTEALENIETALLGDIQEFRPDDDTLNTEAAVQTYLMLREARERGKDRHEERDKVLREHQHRIENALGAFMQRNTSSGLNTKYGTVFTQHQSTARVADKNAFLLYLQESDAWHMATIGANKKEVADHLDKNEGQLPPGVDWSSRVVVQIRRK